MAGFVAYPTHGGQLRQIAERFGIPESQLLDFSANINPAGPPPCVLSTLRASLDDPLTLTAYPHLQQTELKQSLAQYAGVKPENILVANGFVPLLEGTLRALRVHSCLVPVPAFVEYRKSLERMGIEFVPHQLHAELSFEYDTANLITGQQEAILLANPQNPSGVCHNASSMCDLVAWALRKNVYVLLDEAFIDYASEHSLSAMVDRFPNLIVFRSVTKFQAIPGLRVAYAIANPTLSIKIAEHLPPWPITTLASHAVIAALGDHQYAVRSRVENQTERAALQADLETLGLVTYPAAANFILFHLPSSIDPDVFWRNMLVEQHIVLRACTNYDGLAERHFRTAIRSREENHRLTQALAAVLSSLA